jgi:2,3-bisphosphoglycerate-independent phosphoglycerate mutase
MSSLPAQRPIVLCILDGFGWRDDDTANAVRQAKTPNFDGLWQSGPRCFLKACGFDVGLPDGQMGNSEVGHMNIGAGRIVMQDLPRIDQAITSGTLARDPSLVDFIGKLKSSGGKCHLTGVVSAGGVHAHQDHLLALANIIAIAGVPVLVHALLDGRDVAPNSAKTDIPLFAEELAKIGGAGAEIATLCGRYYALDRDNRWERVQLAWELIVNGIGTKAGDALAAITASYDDKIMDEFVLPVVLNDYSGMQDNDGLLMANFRTDRAREILQALLDPTFDGFARSRSVKLAATLGMVPYSTALNALMPAIFHPQSMDNMLGEVVAAAGLTQLRAAETEKYPHVTFFLNGGRETPYDGEDRVLVPSPKVATYDLQPEMSAPELTEKVASAIDSGKLDLVILNYANPDMVGHTGDLNAAIKAVEAVDQGLGKILAAVRRQNGVTLVTADHGNCEMMTDPITGQPHTAHTLNPVPAVLDNGPAGAALRDGRLADIAPTLLALLGVAQPAEMTGVSLLDGSAQNRPHAAA